MHFIDTFEYSGNKSAFYYSAIAVWVYAPMQRCCRLYIIHNTAHVISNPIRHSPLANPALAQPDNHNFFRFRKSAKIMCRENVNEDQNAKKNAAKIKRFTEFLLV